MRQFDFAPYRRATVGFDRLFDLLENSARLQQADNYPPFNIERLSDDRYRITLAVAGFRAEDIDIVAQQNLLQITGRKDEEGEQDRSNFLHMGIANRGFERRFEQIGRAHVRTPVTNAHLVCRLLLEKKKINATQQTQN